MIVWGVCGIGLGHSYRQWPLIQDLLREQHVVVFAYGQSLKFFEARACECKSLEVHEVSVPYLPGGTSGLDFSATADVDGAMNARALARVNELGGPELCVSDYEPVAAQAAYRFGVPLITIDQQSKFLNTAEPLTLDERQRLKLFFPAATHRLASSFFRTEAGEAQIIPPILRPEIEQLTRHPDSSRVLVYLSDQGYSADRLPHLLRALEACGEYRFEVFLPQPPPVSSSPPNVRLSLHRENERAYLDALARCGAMISTAGHTLLSEAMHMHIPVYCLPLALYEQQLNASAIVAGEFGVSSPRLDLDRLRLFLADQERHRRMIAADRRILVRGSGRRQALDVIRRTLQPANA